MGVVVSTVDYSRPQSIQVPDSDIGYHFGTLLDNHEGVDVILNVGGERFHAHKLVLAARSSIFRSNFFDDESDGEKNEVDGIFILENCKDTFEVRPNRSNNLSQTHTCGQNSESMMFLGKPIIICP